MAVMDNAVKKGYTFAWGSDVSEQGFSRDGIAVMPDAAKESELSGSDMARWTGLTAPTNAENYSPNLSLKRILPRKCVKLLLTTGKQQTTTEW